MGKPKDPKVKKIVPRERGEKWTLIDGSSVIVLERKGKWVRCFGGKGFIKTEHENNFREKEAD